MEKHQITTLFLWRNKFRIPANGCGKTFIQVHPGNINHIPYISQSDRRENEDKGSSHRQDSFSFVLYHCVFNDGL